MPDDFPRWIEDNRDTYWAWLRSQRWFGDKSRELEQFLLSQFGMVVLPPDNVLLLTATCHFADGGEVTYFTPLKEDKTSDSLVDALQHAPFVTWLAEGFAETRSLPASLDQGATVLWTGSGGEADWSTQPAGVFTGEQSNTSIVYGEHAVLKVFRKLQPGINPDSEIVEFLTGHTPFQNAPRYLGGINLRYEDGLKNTELAAVQGFVPNSGDSWHWLVPELATRNAEHRRSLLEPVELLGRRTGELHAALATPSEDQAFMTELYDEGGAEAEQRRLVDELDQTFGMLDRANILTPDDCRNLERQLRSRLEKATDLSGMPRTRVHGDYHLGQVLRSGDDFVIIDFEGEPSRTMAERRRKHSPLKDVAGMLRSLDYAVSSAQLVNPDAIPAELTEWGAQAEERFTSGYIAAVQAAPIQLVPQSRAAFQRALDLFMVEKALYETRYELDNRPDWLGIPLGALSRIAGQS